MKHSDVTLLVENLVLYCNVMQDVVVDEQLFLLQEQCKCILCCNVCIVLVVMV